MIRHKLLIISLIALSAITVGLVEVLAQTKTVPTETVVIPQPTSIDPTSVPESNLNVGARNPQVKKIQEILKSLGYLPADFEPTQYFGPLTREAIKKFQSDNNLPALGSFGPATRRALKDKLQSEVGLSQQSVNIACMKGAVEKRENTLIAAYTTLTDKIKAARETRKTDLLNAWTIQDAKERHKTINDAWVKFKKSSREARIEWLKSRAAVWIQFEKDRRTCNTPATGENQSLEEVETTE